MLIDLARLEDLKELGGDEFVFALWTAFLEICATEMPNMHAAFAVQNVEEIARLAHLFKSAGGNVGATGLYGVAERLETCALAREDFAAVTALVAELDQCYQNTLSSETAPKAA